MFLVSTVKALKKKGTIMSVLEIKDLHVEIEGKEILKGVNLTLKTGEIAAIMGHGVTPMRSNRTCGLTKHISPLFSSTATWMV